MDKTVVVSFIDEYNKLVDEFKFTNYAEFGGFMFVIRTLENNEDIFTEFVETKITKPKGIDFSDIDFFTEEHFVGGSSICEEECVSEDDYLEVYKKVLKDLKRFFEKNLENLDLKDYTKTVYRIVLQDQNIVSYYLINRENVGVDMSHVLVGMAKAAEFMGGKVEHAKVNSVSLDDIVVDDSDSESEDEEHEDEEHEDEESESSDKKEDDKGCGCK